MIRLFVFLATVVLCLPVVQASDDDAALKRIQEEVASRRKLRQQALDARGIVFAPAEVSDEWLREKRELKIDEVSLGLCGQTFATLIQKEVMVSARVVKKEITLNLGPVTGEEAQAAFRKALVKHGVAIVPVGAHALALVAAEDLAK
ncbi:MAG: hypothetical protein NDI75_01750 [Candidatus Didemnitutus sp.]|nr:hypothetical protein [Candidatus Didemnitutus sp.]